MGHVNLTLDALLSGAENSRENEVSYRKVEIFMPNSLAVGRKFKQDLLQS
jgi:hypothetical protein